MLCGRLNKTVNEKVHRCIISFPATGQLAGAMQTASQIKLGVSLKESISWIATQMRHETGSGSVKWRSSGKLCLDVLALQFGKSNRCLASVLVLFLVPTLTLRVLCNFHTVCPFVHYTIYGPMENDRTDRIE
jgi:hypothetical protein